MADAPEYGPHQTEAQQLIAAVDQFLHATPEEQAEALTHRSPFDVPPIERTTSSASQALTTPDAQSNLVDALTVNKFTHLTIKDLFQAIRITALKRNAATGDAGTTRRELLLRVAADLVVGATAVLTAKEMLLQNLARILANNTPEENTQEVNPPFFPLYEGTSRGPVTNIPGLIKALNHDGQLDPARFLLGTDPFTIHDPTSMFTIPAPGPVDVFTYAEQDYVASQGYLISVHAGVQTNNIRVPVVVLDRAINPSEAAQHTTLQNKMMHFQGVALRCQLLRNENPSSAFAKSFGTNYVIVVEGVSSTDGMAQPTPTRL